MYMRKSKLLALSAAMIVTSATAYGAYAADSARSGKAKKKQTSEFFNADLLIFYKYKIHSDMADVLFNRNIAHIFSYKLNYINLQNISRK